MRWRTNSDRMSKYRTWTSIPASAPISFALSLREIAMSTNKLEYIHFEMRNIHHYYSFDQYNSAPYSHEMPKTFLVLT